MWKKGMALLLPGGAGDPTNVFVSQPLQYVLSPAKSPCRSELLHMVCVLICSLHCDKHHDLKPSGGKKEILWLTDANPSLREVKAGTY